MSRAVKSFLSPKYSFFYFSVVFLLFYAVLPFFVFIYTGDYYLSKLSVLTCLSFFCVYCGCRFNFLDVFFKPNFKRFYIPVWLFVFVVWFGFSIYVFYTFYTADAIPFLSAISGAGDAEVSSQRGAFLKGRSGYEGLLIYVGTLFSSVLIPYSIVMMFFHGYRYRYFFVFAFICYCVSFMAKTLFLSIVLPLFVYFSLIGKLSVSKAISVVFGSILVMFFFIYLVSEGSLFDVGISDSLFFTSSYVPSGALDYLIWRMFSVPVFTASESLMVFDSYFGGKPLLGATSSFLALVFDVARVNFERYVFMYQFGSWNEIANSNAYFVVDSYVNFSIFGVLFYSFIVGLFLRFFKISRDVSFASLWLLFVFHLFSASLIGTLLSNGFLLILFISVFFKIGRSALTSRENVYES